MSDLQFPRLVYRGPTDQAETARCESADDLETMTAAGWRLRRLVPAIPAPVITPVSGTSEGAVFDPLAVNATAVKDYLATADATECERVRAAEISNPAYSEGRVGVLKAVDDRLAELNG